MACMMDQLNVELVKDNYDCKHSHIK